MSLLSPPVKKRTIFKVCRLKTALLGTLDDLDLSSRPPRSGSRWYMPPGTWRITSASSTLAARLSLRTGVMLEIQPKRPELP